MTNHKKVTQAGCDGGQRDTLLSGPRACTGIRTIFSSFPFPLFFPEGECLNNVYSKDTRIVLQELALGDRPVLDNPSS